MDAEKEKEMAQKMKKGKLDFEMFLESMKQMRSMGGLGSIMNLIPGMGKISDDQLPDEKSLKRMEAIVLSMTPAERKNPKLMSPQRKYRIAKGSGNDIAAVNRFIKQFEQMNKMMKQMPGLMGGRRGFGRGLGGFGRGKFPF